MSNYSLWSSLAEENEGQCRPKCQTYDFVNKQLCQDVAPAYYLGQVSIYYIERD